MTTDRTLNEQWHKALGQLIEHLRMRSFPDVLVKTLQNLADFNTFVVATYKYQYQYQPIVIASSYAEKDSPLQRSYLSGAYVLDPLFNAINQHTASGLYRLKEMAPDEFEQTQYFQQCYQDFQLSDEIIFLCRLDNDVVFTVSLGRTASLGTITRGERNRLKEVFPVIQALCHQFWLAQSTEYVHDQKAQNTLDQALHSFGSGVLTDREQEISGLILQGHSSKAIADQLDISAGTVKVHRKNIYTKLNISAQSELFSMFLTHLSSLQH